MKRDCSKLISKVVKLLEQGMSPARISSVLHIGRKRLNGLITRLRQCKDQGRQRISGLHRYHLRISRWVREDRSLSFIRERLPCRYKKLHRSTILRYIRQHCWSLRHLSDPPGAVAYVSVVRIEHTENICLFSLLLGYSHYGYFALFRFAELQPFLHCHARCFEHLGGVPRTIRLCDMSCLRLSRKDNTCYRRFLAHFGAKAEEQWEDPEKAAPANSK